MLQPPPPPPPPFLRPVARRGEGKRARGLETTRKQTAAPTSPPTTSLQPPLPTMPCGARARHRWLRPAQAQQAAPAAENYELVRRQSSSF